MWARAGGNCAAAGGGHLLYVASAISDHRSERHLLQQRRQQRQLEDGGRQQDCREPHAEAGRAATNGRHTKQGDATAAGSAIIHEVRYAGRGGRGGGSGW
jgi:hypothetical protein